MGITETGISKQETGSAMLTNFFFTITVHEELNVKPDYIAFYIYLDYFTHVPIVQWSNYKIGPYVMFFWGWGTWYNVLRHNGKWYSGIRHNLGNGNQA